MRSHIIVTNNYGKCLNSNNMEEIKASEELCCRWCGEAKDDVRYRVDPYSYEICNDDNTYPLCDDCAYERAMDV